MEVRPLPDFENQVEIARLLIGNHINKLNIGTMKVLMKIFWKTFDCPTKKVSRRSLKKKIKISKKEIKAALNTLKNLGLISKQKNGKSFVYSISNFVYSW